ncbi:MAG: radical SAM family heme chaperone HemW [Syntrophomonas sp.]
MDILEKTKAPWGIYIHIPFCLRKCAYCDFFSLPNASPELYERYTNAVVAEIERRSRDLHGPRVSTIYFGGGTPSLLNGKQIKNITQAVKKHFMVLNDAEISLEANPATLDASLLNALSDAGINRLSLGVQSFCDDELKILGRIHGRREVMDTIAILHKEGWNNFNVDLIYGIPGQTIERWKENLWSAVESGAMHISAYLLQPGYSTPMAREIEKGGLQMLDEDDESLMYYTAVDCLPEKGFEQYEISNFCRRGFACRHNLTYWQAGHYIGIGAGAVSFIGSSRYINQPRLEEYMDCLENGKQWPVEELERMSSLQLLSDAIITGLRMCPGINMEEISSRFGLDMEHEFAPALKTGIDEKLLKLENGQLSLTKRGYFLSNRVLCQFIT